MIIIAGWMKDAETKVNGGVYYEYAASLAEEGNYIDAAASYEKVIALETVADEYKDAADKAKKKEKSKEYDEIEKKIKHVRNDIRKFSNR